MEANIRTAHDLFYNPGRYVIPIYQRPYVWDKEGQWLPLWSDIKRTAEHYVDPSYGSENDHFLGAIVLQQEETAPGSLARWTVIDGQQRLVTFQILLDAAEYVLRQLGDDVEDEASNIHDLIENSRRRRDPDDPDSRFKVWPTAGDQDEFRRVMTMSSAGDRQGASQAKIAKAHRFFREQIHAWVTADDHQVVTRARALGIALSEKFKVVAISLDDTDNPNVIFEALNARGTPLLEWDLVKNELIHSEAQAGGSATTLYAQHIKPIEEDGWWRENVRRGRLFVPRLDALLFYWLTLRTQHNVPADHVFDTFKQYVVDKTPTGVAADLGRVAEIYSTLELTTDHTPLGKFLSRWRATEMGVLTPNLLWLLSNDVPPACLAQCLSAFESFVVRRVVCGIGSAGLNDDMARLLRELVERGPEYADRTVVTFLSSQPPGRAVWPDDDSFRRYLLDEPLYGRLPVRRVRMIIEALNAKLEADADAVIVEQQELHVEHVMPQKWQLNYKMARSADWEEQVRRREHRIQTLGNLTLTTAKLNATMSSGPWEVKQQYLKRAGLALNQELIEHAPAEWTEAAIAARSERLADLALEIWPRPEGRFRLL